MYSIYARTRGGKIIKGTSNAATASAALAEAHTAAAAANHEITKATVKFLENKSAFNVVEARATETGSPASGAAPAARGNGGKKK